MDTFRPSTKLLFVERDKECKVTDKETTVMQAAGTWSFVFHSFSMRVDLLNIEQDWQYTYEGWNFHSGNYLFTTDTK